MLFCPSCGTENIEGADLCEQCSQPLTDLSIRVPSSSVEADLLRDRLDVIPAHDPVTVPPEATVAEVLQLMSESRIGCVMVVHQEKLVGIFTERDALMRLNVEAPRMAERPIADFMTSNPAVIEAGAKIAYALHMMDVGGYRHLPIMQGEKPVNVISIRDILKYLTGRIAASASPAK